MFDLKKIRFQATAAILAIIVAAPVAVAQAASGMEKLKAHPASVMVNSDTTIAGNGFTPHTMVSLTECGVTLWLAPNDPCNTENVTTVETNAKGSFKTPFDVQLCPEGKHAHRPTTVICYVGVRHFVEDVEMLEPAAKVKVTYP